MPGELIVAGCDAAEVLQSAEGGLDTPATLVTGLIVLDLHLAVRAPRNDGLGAFGLQAPAQLVGIVALVGN